MFNSLEHLLEDRKMLRSIVQEYDQTATTPPKYVLDALEHTEKRIEALTTTRETVARR